jgi:hypothetical protein
LTANLPKSFLPEPLAEAGAGGNRPNVRPGRSSFITLICRCPAGAFLAANRRARAAAGGRSSCARRARHRRFDHGYAVTSHSAQGLTAERVLIHADTSVHPDFLSSRFGYVALSRASHEAMIFTDDANQLAQQLGKEVTKTAASKIN